MQTWIIGLVLLGIGLPLISSQDVKDKEVVFEVKRFRLPNPIRLEPYDDNEDYNETGEDEEENAQIEIDDTTVESAQDPAGILIKDSDLDGHAGILVIQNGVSPNTPLLFELRPVATDQKNQYFQAVEDSSPVIMNEEDEEDEDYNNNKYEVSDSDDYEEPLSTKRRQRPIRKPIQKPKRKPVKLNQKPNQKPKRRPNRPTSAATQPKPNRRKNPGQNQNKNRKRINNRISGSPDINRNNSKRQNSNKRVNSNKNRIFAASVNQGSGVNTVTNTMTTTQTGTANDVPDVNYIIINKPSSTSTTTERPFWGLLGRDANDIGTPRS